MKETSELQQSADALLVGYNDAKLTNVSYLYSSECAIHTCYRRVSLSKNGAVLACQLRACADKWALSRVGRAGRGFELLEEVCGMQCSLLNAVMMTTICRNAVDVLS